MKDKDTKFYIKYHGKINNCGDLFHNAEKWPKHGSQEYEVLKASNNRLMNIKHKSNIVVFAAYESSTNQLAALFPVRLVGNTCHIAGYLEKMDYVDFIYNPIFIDSVPEVLNSFSQSLKGRGITKLRSRFVDSNSPTWLAIKDSSSISLDETVDNVAIDPVANYNEWFASLSKHARQNMRTAYNRIRKSDKHSGYKLKIIRGAISKYSAADRRIYRRCFKIYSGRQKNQYGYKKDIFFKAKMLLGNYVFVSSKQNKKSYLAALMIDNDVAAFFLGFYNNHNNSIEIPKLSINNKYSFYSPGMVLISEIAKHYSRKKTPPRIDLCRGTEGYKTILGGKVYNTINFTFRFGEKE